MKKKEEKYDTKERRAKMKKQVLDRFSDKRIPMSDKDAETIVECYMRYRTYTDAVNNIQDTKIRQTVKKAFAHLFEYELEKEHLVDVLKMLKDAMTNEKRFDGLGGLDE